LRAAALGASRMLPILGLAAFSGDAGRDSDKLTFFRATSAGELANIRATGMFNPSPNGSEMKQFWTNIKDARAFGGAMNTMLNSTEYQHIVSVALSMSTAAIGVPGSDPIGGVFRPYITYSGAGLVPLNRDALANGIQVLK
jgi:hypothetical protein